MSDNSPHLDTITDMTNASVGRTGLSDREWMMVRICALAAVAAPVSSSFLNMGVAIEAGRTAEDAHGVLVAVAPIIGSPSAVAAAATIAEADGLAVANDDAIQEQESPGRPPPSGCTTDVL
jgi:hypothetical protein